MVAPYYQHNGITIYHGDCRALALPEQPALILADPPYGINYQHGKGATKNGKNPNRGHLPPVAGDDEPFDPAHILRFRTPTILWGANHYADKLPASPAWYVWDKRDGIRSNDNSDCELAWANFGGSIRVYRHVWSGVIRATESGEKHLHSTQKPVALMIWCLLRAELAPAALVYDPYMGSGPIAKACKQLGYRYIGCELVKRHCETAALGLQQEVMEAFI